MSANIVAKIESTIKENDIVLFMKGNAMSPMCGFSGTVVNILNSFDVSFKDVDVLESMDLRQAIKEYSDWPTIPQLYVKGEFIGGCDILTEMYNSGELRKLLIDREILSISSDA